MTIECPTCEKSGFKSEGGMKQHHTKVHGESLLKTECDNCDGDIPKPHQTKRFCSRECFKDFHSEDVECEICGEEFSEKKWRIEQRGRRFCSKGCVTQWKKEYFKGHEVSEEARRRISQAIRKPGISSTMPYGDNWEGQRQKAIKRDDEECTRCGMSRNENRRRYKQDLSVHHEKSRRFILHHPFLTLEEQGNSLSNLTTLCIPCHMQIERQRTDY